MLHNRLMADLEKYRQEINMLLNSLAMYMHSTDVDQVRDEITAAASTTDLDYLRFSLKFHQFRIKAAQARGEIIELKSTR
jgi:hypothetical protein